MRLIHVKPYGITHRVSSKTTAEHLDRITSWLKQWTVPNNHEQCILDLEDPSYPIDIFKEIAGEFLQSYRNVVSNNVEDHVLDDFKFQIRVYPVTLGKPFWPSDGRQNEYTVRQLLEGVHANIK